jgi:hypothetical protein
LYPSPSLAQRRKHNVDLCAAGDAADSNAAVFLFINTCFLFSGLALQQLQQQ